MGGGESKNYIILEFVRSRVKIKSNKDLQSPKLKVELNLISQVYGYVENAHLDNADTVQELEKEAEKTIGKQIKDLLEKLKEMQVDPAQLGEAFRICYPHQWSKELWNDTLSETEFDVEVKVEITKADYLG